MRKMYYLLFFISIASQAQVAHPIPPKGPNHLFYIQHSQNHNTFVYEANIKSKKIDQTEPIKIHRITYTKGGIKEELTKVQRNVAYGIDIKKNRENQFVFSLVSYPEKKLYLEINANGNPQVRTTVNGKKIVLYKMFLNLQKGIWIKPKIESIDFYGLDVETGKEIKEIFYINS